jgi:uncharacterized protein YjbI with pentapeptide repeats
VPTSPTFSVDVQSPTPLQSAIDAAPVDSVIEVPAGEYRESVVVKKSVHFVAVGEVVISSDTVRDTIQSDCGFASFKGFTIRQTESQIAHAVLVVSGEVLFLKCRIQSNNTVAVNVRRDGAVFLQESSVSSGAKSALVSIEEGSVVAENSTFKSRQGPAVRIGGTSRARLRGSTAVETNGAAFEFVEQSQFLVEESSITTVFDVRTNSDVAVFKNCEVQGVNLKIGGATIAYVAGSTFRNTSLETCGLAGVRLVDSKFLDNESQPGLLAYGQSTVNAIDCKFKNSRAGSAAVVYNEASLTIADGTFVDIAGVGILAFGSVVLDIAHCGFGNISSAAIYAQNQQTSVSIVDTLVDRVGGVGIVLRNLQKASLARSKVTNAHLSGLEISGFVDIDINRCVFENNGQCGIIAVNIGGLKVNESDFVGNQWTGLDVRDNSIATVTGSVALTNPGGGFAFRKSRAEVSGGGAAQNGQFGLAVEDGGTVTGRDVRILENSGIGAYATDGSSLSLDSCIFSKQAQVAVFAQGSGTKLHVGEGDFSDNGMGVQVAKAEADVSSSKFAANAIHLEASDDSRVVVQGTTFKQSGNGLGVFVTSGSTGEFSECEFAEEPKSGLASDATVTITGSKVKDCSTCGLFFFGDAKATVENCEITDNASCGIQVMGGSVQVTGGKIENHTIFGIHVDSSALLTETGISYSSNSMADFNRE